MEILNTYCPCIPIRDNAKGAGFIAVLTADESGAQAVYIGIAGDMFTDSPEYDGVRFAASVWVSYNGAKQTYNQAKAYFPGIEESKYRR